MSMDISDNDRTREGIDADDYDNEFLAGEEYQETDQLALQRDDEINLPWLEADDDGAYSGYQGSDTGRILGFVLLSLVGLAAIIGGIWWASHRNADPALVADGSTIEAPDQAYKEAPADPGGKKFDGTGDSSFAVSEGQTRPAQLGNAADTAAKPSIDLAPKPTVAAGVDAGAAAPAAAAGGVGVQVGAYSTSASAEAGWAKLTQQSSALSGMRHRVQEGKADIGTVYRLQAVAADSASANALCGRLKASGIACQVKN